MMFVIQQFLIILAVSFAGEMAHALLPFPVPASIYGLLFMLVLLLSGAVKLCQIEKATGFFLEIMPVLFIPAAAGIISTWDDIKTVIGAVTAVITVTTLIVMIASGVTTQKIIQYLNKRGKGNADTE